MTLSRRFETELKSLFPGGLPSSVAVACSGGLDSMVLLELLAGMRKQSALSAIHLDHGQRSPEEAEADQRVVRDYCTRHGLGFIFERLALAPGASEAEMRSARYLALARLAGPAVVFTAHHCDDELETLLFKLIRGAHPETLRGIAPRARRRLGDGSVLRLARPLLAIRKAELATHAHANSLKFLEDASNRSPRYARNRIRNELIPLLNDLRAGGADRVLRFLAGLKASAVPTKKKQRVSRELRSKQGHKVTDADFQSLQSAVYDLIDGNGGRTTRAHWESLKRQLDFRRQTRRGTGPTKTIQFPGGHSLVFRGDRLFWVENR